MSEELKALIDQAIELGVQPPAIDRELQESVKKLIARKKLALNTNQTKEGLAGMFQAAWKAI